VVRIDTCGYHLVAASRFSSLSGAFACDSKKAYQPGGSRPRAFFCPPRIHKSAGRANRGVARCSQSSWTEVHSGCCAPGALRFIPASEFLNARPQRLHLGNGVLQAAD